MSLNLPVIRCEYTIQKGPRAGEVCNKIIRGNYDVKRCGAHTERMLLSKKARSDVQSKIRSENRKIEKAEKRRQVLLETKKTQFPNQPPSQEECMVYLQQCLQDYLAAPKKRS